MLSEEGQEVDRRRRTVEGQEEDKMRSGGGQKEIRRRTVVRKMGVQEKDKRMTVVIKEKYRGRTRGGQ